MTPWRPARRKVRIDLTSMIDVVFMLLLFLIVAARFDQQGAVSVDLPHDGRPSSTAPHPLIVTVTARGVTVAGQVVTGDPGAEAARRRAAEPSSTVVLQADAGVPYEKVFGVLSSLSEAGIPDVGLAYDVR